MKRDLWAGLIVKATKIEVDLRQFDEELMGVGPAAVAGADIIQELVSALLEQDEYHARARNRAIDAVKAALES